MAISSGGIGRPRRGRIYIVVGAILAVLAFGTAAAVASLPLLVGTTSGTKVVVAGTEITSVLLEKLRNFAALSGIQEPILAAG